MYSYYYLGPNQAKAVSKGDKTKNKKFQEIWQCATVCNNHLNHLYLSQDSDTISIFVYSLLIV